MKKIEMVEFYDRFFTYYQDRIVSYLGNKNIPLYNRVELQELYTGLKSNILLLIDDDAFDYVVEDRTCSLIESMEKIKYILGKASLESVLDDIDSTKSVFAGANKRYSFFIETILLETPLYLEKERAFAIAGNDRSYKLDIPSPRGYDVKALYAHIAVVKASDSEYDITVQFYKPSYSTVDMSKAKGGIRIANRFHDIKHMSADFILDAVQADTDKYKQCNRFKYCKQGSEYLEISRLSTDLDVNLYVASISIENSDKKSENDVSFAYSVDSKFIETR